jgi:hypothetical protein
MAISNLVQTLISAKPAGWNFLYALRENILAYEGAFPLMFAEVSPYDATLVANTALSRTFRQSISFMILDEQDSLGIELQTPVGINLQKTTNTIIQLTNMNIALLACEEFVFNLNAIDSIEVSTPRVTPTPRFLWSGGQALVGVTLSVNITPVPVRC